MTETRSGANIGDNAVDPLMHTRNETIQYIQSCACSWMHTKHFANDACGLANVLVDDGRGDHLHKVGLHILGHRACEQCLAGAGRAVEKHAWVEGEIYCVRLEGIQT